MYWGKNGSRKTNEAAIKVIATQVMVAWIGVVTMDMKKNRLIGNILLDAGGMRTYRGEYRTSKMTP